MTLLNGTFGVEVDTNPASSSIFNVAGVLSVQAGGIAGTTYTFAGTGTGGDIAVTRDLGGTGTDVSTITLTGGNPADGSGSLIIAEFGINIQLGSGYSEDGLNTVTITMTGSGGQIQTGANKNDNLSINIGNMKSTALGISSSTIADGASAQDALDAVNTAINTVSTQRAELGAIQNRLEHKINNLDTSAENLSAAESRIRDLDMAAEMTKFTSSNILIQAATAMLAQANAAPQSVLQLLK